MSQTYGKLCCWGSLVFRDEGKLTWSKDNNISITAGAPEASASNTSPVSGGRPIWQTGIRADRRSRPKDSEAAGGISWGAASSRWIPEAPQGKFLLMTSVTGGAAGPGPKQMKTLKSCRKSTEYDGVTGIVLLCLLSLWWKPEILKVNHFHHLSISCLLSRLITWSLDNIRKQWKMPTTVSFSPRSHQ